MKAAIFVASVLSQSAYAFVPATGLWATDAIDGQGFNIEVQDNTMIVTAYVFDGGGNQIWYLAAGTYNETNDSFVGAFANATGGSCLGCIYKPPTKALAGVDIQITFTSRETASAKVNGETRQLTHLNFGYGGNQNYFNGEWQFSYQGFAGVVESQWVVFPGTTYLDSSTGTLYQSGYEDQYSSSAALGRYTSGTYLVGVADGYGNTWIYTLKGDNQRMLGIGGSSGSTSYKAQGSRVLTPHELTDPTHALSSPQALSQRYAELAAIMSGGVPVAN